MINGIQHIGIGVQDRDRSYAFYNDGLGFSVPMSKSTDSCSGMLPVLGKDETRNVIISLNPHGGALVEIFQYVSRNPEPVPEDIDFSYNGFLFYGIKVRNIEKSLSHIVHYGGEIVSGPAEFSPLNNNRWKTAVFKDPDGIYGIMLEYPGNNVGYGKGKIRIGGVEYIAIGVSNLERSIDFYKNILGYSKVIYRHEGICPEWAVLFGENRYMKRALLQRNDKPRGLFKHFLRGGMIELIEVAGNKRRHNFDGRTWGDIGFMELCFDVDDINETLRQINTKGIPTAIPPHSQNMGLNTQATFAYIKDPDGSLIEFADIKRLPVPYIMIRLLVNPTIIKLAKKLRFMK
jgi:catechol 2,3-dioxygenase-like lactoylglutathione lyase family enzyme